MKVPEHLIPHCIRHKVKRNSSFNSKEREAIRLYLLIRDGDECAICNKPPAENETLDIDHIDGDKTNCFHENLQLAHHKCNTRKNSKGWKKKDVDFLCVCVSECVMPPAQTAELSSKLVYYPAFMQYLYRKFIDEKVSVVDIEDLAKNLFYKTGGSSVTFKRYAQDMCGSESPFMLYPDKKTNKLKYLALKGDEELNKLMFKKYVKD